MPILTHDCPRCGTSHAAFRYKAEYQGLDGANYVVFACPRCEGPATVKVVLRPDGGFKALSGDIQDWQGSAIQWVEPAPIAPKSPEHVPPSIAALYEEACDGIGRNSLTSAASVLRKCLELALREFAPDVQAWKLEKRIDTLASKHLITPALQQWAHQLRLDGNEALHGDETPPADLVQHMERLTYFLLTYLYTLPRQVAIAQELQRDNG